MVWMEVGKASSQEIRNFLLGPQKINYWNKEFDLWKIFFYIDTVVKKYRVNENDYG